MKMRSIATAVATIAISLLASNSAEALELEQIGSFTNPIYVTSPPGDASRIFVVERAGTIKLVEDGTVSTYVDLTGEVACCQGERGLASIAFDPNFATSRKLYVAYTTEGNLEGEEGDIVVEELTAPEEPADPEEPEGPFVLRPVLLIPHDQFNIHNGGQLQFGPDGMLYLSTGDGGHFDPREAPQDPESGLGKILRFDPDAAVDYDVPAGNPFAGSGFAPIVWALGLRNPFRFSFDRLTGDLVIGDVGEGTSEEIDWALSPGTGQAGGKGDNYGWSCREGSLPGLGAGDPFCAGLGAVDFDSPVFEYGHVAPDPAKGIICSGSIIGGYVVRDSSLGALAGRYVYADYCTGAIRSLQLPSTPGGIATDDCSLGLPFSRPTSFGEDAAGRLYITSNAGGVYRFTGPPRPACPMRTTPTATRTPLPLAAPRSPRRRSGPSFESPVASSVAGRCGHFFRSRSHPVRDRLSAGCCCAAAEKPTAASRSVPTAGCASSAVSPSAPPSAPSSSRALARPAPARARSSSAPLSKTRRACGGPRWPHAAA